jgi:phosphoribosylformylglycinamidine synthase
MFKIEILTKKGFKNSYAKRVLSDISGIGIKNITKVKYSPLYFIEGDISFINIEILASELLCDKITETYIINPKFNNHSYAFYVIEIRYKNGVTDVIAESVLKAARDLGIFKKITVSTGQKYYIYSNSIISKATLSNISTKLLANTLVQEYTL